MADADAVQGDLTAKRVIESEAGKQPESDKKEEEAPKTVDDNNDDGKDDNKADDDDNDNDDGDDEEIKKGTHNIKFKWRGVKEKKECDTKHMLYLLHLALEKTRIRQIERNKNFASLGRKDRIMKHPDYPGIITKFIEWHNKDFTNNKFDGNLLETKGKKDVTNNVIAKIGDIKWGWATKAYHYLTKEVTIDAEWGECKIPNYGHTKLASDGKTLDECSVEDIKKVLEDSVFKELANGPKAWPLDPYKEKIIEFFTKEKINGLKFKSIGKKQLVEQLKNSLDPDNKKIRGPCTKLYAKVEKANLNEIFKQ